MSRKYLLDCSVVVELSDDFVHEADWHKYFASELALADETSDGLPTVRLSIDATIGHHPLETFGVSGGLLADGSFVIPDGAGHWCRINPNSLNVAAVDLNLSVCCPLLKKNVLLDWVIFPSASFAAAALGVVPIHASAATGAGKCFVFSAWSGVGKTNLVLSALSQGGAYFGDDRVHVDRCAHVRKSERRVSVYGYNRQLVAGLDRPSRVKLWLGETLHRYARGRMGRFAYVLAYLANGFGSKRISAAELGATRSSEIAKVDAHVICRGVAGLSGPRVHEVDGQSDRRAWSVCMADRHVAVMEYEFVWFGRYLQTWRWAMGSGRDPWSELTNSWRQGLVDYLMAVPRVLELQLPLGSPSYAAEPAWALLLDAVKD